MQYSRLLLLALATVATGAPAQDYTIGSMHITHPWSRALPDVARHGAVYMTLVNNDQTTDRLVSGSSPIAARVSLHRQRWKAG